MLIEDNGLVFSLAILVLCMFVMQFNSCMLNYFFQYFQYFIFPLLNILNGLKFLKFVDKIICN